MKSKLPVKSICVTLVVALFSSCASDDPTSSRRRATPDEMAVVAGCSMFGIAGGLVGAVAVAAMDHEHQKHLNTQYSPHASKGSATTTQGVNGRKIRTDGSGTQYLVQ